MRIRKDELFARLPDEWPEPLLPRIQERLGPDERVIVLDDDPTGTQTVHDVPVLTAWSPDVLASELGQPGSVIYILTNSRSVPTERAEAISREIALALQDAAQRTGKRVTIISRSDSTLRGHYPAEVRALQGALGQPVDGVLLIPFFLEGGRYTIGDVHYVQEGAWLTPAAETEFARDAAFGYRHSNLRRWAMEKHGGTLPPEAVTSLSLEEIRTGGPEAVAKRLRALSGGMVCAVNAASYRDLEVLVLGLLAAEAEGSRFLFRTAASFVRVRGGIAPAPLLGGADLGTSQTGRGGLIVAGSYVNRTTEQIEAAMQLSHTLAVEVSVPRLLGDGAEAEVRRAQRAAEAAIRARRDVLVYTSRQRVAGSDQANSLDIGQRISQGLVRIVRGLQERPAWVIAKGGITSSDTATQGLGVQRAWVLGQSIPGVPIWRTGPESRWPGLVYVVFPGNVGGPDAVAQMIRILHGQQKD
jgi:uncharacterized protein YgbK (DUF1537 family)